MADRSIAAGDTLRKLFIEFNATAEDIGDISGITGASGIIASATDVVEAITTLNTDLTTRNIATRGNRGYPADTITGYASYYNLVRDIEEWNVTGFPLIQAVVGDYLSLKSDERVGISCWGNILRLDRKIFPHLHFGVPDGWEEVKQSVSANIFLGAEVATATTYILDGEQVDIPNVYGQFTLFPPNVPHAVRAYKGSGRHERAAVATV